MSPVSAVSSSEAAVRPFYAWRPTVKRVTELPFVDSTVEREVDRLLDTTRAVASLVLTAVAWVAFAAVSAGWLVFWSALARVHVLHGDPLAAALSVGAIVVPIAVLLYVRSKR